MRRFFGVSRHISIEQLTIIRIAIYVVACVPTLIVNRTTALAANGASPLNRRQNAAPIDISEKRLHRAETVAGWILSHRNETSEIAAFIRDASFAPDCAADNHEKYTAD
jgi:hypothetical protein